MNIDKQCYSPLINSFNENNGNVMIVGEYKESSKISDSSIGLFVYEINAKGETVIEKELNYETDFSKLGLVGKGKDEDKNTNYYHTAVVLKNNRVCLVSEEIKKQADGVGIAVKALGGNASMANLKISDLEITELDKEYNPVSITLIPKSPTVMQLPE
jgi:hypothetical protein